MQARVDSVTSSGKAACSLIYTISNKYTFYFIFFKRTQCSDKLFWSRTHDKRHRFTFLSIYVFLCVMCVFRHASEYLFRLPSIFLQSLLDCEKQALRCTICSHNLTVLCDIWGGACKVWNTSKKQGQVTKDEVTYPFSANSVFLNHGRHSRAFGTEFQNKFSLLWVTRCLPSVCVCAFPYAWVSALSGEVGEMSLQTE